MNKLFIVLVIICAALTGCSFNKCDNGVSDYKGILAFEGLLDKGDDDGLCYQELNLANYSHGDGPVIIKAVYFNSNRIPSVNLDNEFTFDPYPMEYTETAHYRVYDCSVVVTDIKIILSTEEIYYLRGDVK